MTPDIALGLDAINREFYGAAASDFSATRRAPWPGWTRLLEIVGPVASVLDAGCGNGRFSASVGDVDYLGVDASPALLSEAPGVRTVVGDVFDSPWGTRRFDLVVAFGVMHHVPGRDRRLELVRLLAAASTSFLAITAWRFDPARAVDWSRVGLSPMEVDDGDYLLPFGTTDAVRYCHLASDAEVDEWIDGSGMMLAGDFEADGRDGASNRYIVLSRR